MIKKILYFSSIAVVLYLLLPFGGTWFYRNDLREIYVLVLAFLLAVIFTPLAIKAAFKFKILDIPNNRKIHSKPMPRIGGLAIFLAFIIAVLRNYHFPKEVIGLLSGLVLLFSVELLDDIKSNSAFLRLGAQASAAIILIISGVYITIIPVFTGSILLNYLLTIVWVVGIINAVNFLDGIDGLAAGLGIISGLSLFAIIHISGQAELSYLLIAFIGACSGFILFNFKPAKIFLGDSGSSVIGFLLASFAIMGVWNKNSVITGFAIPVLIMGIPIFDMLYTTISRIKNGSVSTLREWIEFTGKDHFHHRLMHLGFSRKATVFFLYVLNFILGSFALVLTNAREKEALLIVFQAVLIFGIIVVLMRMGRKPV